MIGSTAVRLESARVDLLRLKLFAAADEGPGHYPGGRCLGLDEILNQIPVR